MALHYFSGDERPEWQPTISVNGTGDDLTSGYTFRLKVVDGAGTVALTKTTGMTGGTGGAVTVAWDADELALAAGRYTVQLTASRDADLREWTITDTLNISTRY